MTTDRFKELADDDLTFRPAETPEKNRTEDPEALSNLYRLPRARWRSLGEHLDYSHWPERERFVQLDREIMAARGRESDQLRPVPRRCASVLSRSPNRIKGVNVVRRIKK